MTRFFILGTARCGSNFFLNLLSSHKNIFVYEELFNLDRLSRDLAGIIIENPVKYLEDKLYAKFHEDIMAVCFKIFYDHFTPDYFIKNIDVNSSNEYNRNRMVSFDDFINKTYKKEYLEQQFNKLWNYLGGDNDLKIIHLKRRNLLKTYLSLKKAYTTGEWLKIKDTSCNSNRKITIDYPECLKYFERIETFEKKYDDFFRHKNVLTLFYEDLAQNQELALASIFNFLSIPSQRLRSVLKKQIQGTLQENIINYPEAKQFFNNSKWIKYFEE